MQKNTHVLKKPPMTKKSKKKNGTGAVFGQHDPAAFEAQRRRAHAINRELKKSLFGRFVQHCPYAISVLDAQGHALMLNEPFRRLFEIPPEVDFLGQNALDLPANREYDVIPLLEKALAGEAVEYSDNEFCTPYTGKRIVISGKTFPIKDARGAVTHVVLAHEDVTERKVAEEQLAEYREHLEDLVGERTEALAQVNVALRREVEVRRKAEKELVRVQKLESLGVLAGGIAHDFNNLLTEIVGGTSVVKARLKPKDECFETLSAVERACAHARELTAQLLTFAKGGDPVKKTIRIDSLVRDGVALSLRGAAVEIVWDLEGALWPCACDAGQIHQVVTNLVRNARQAMHDRGTLRIALHNCDLSDGAAAPLLPGRYVRLSIADSGSGIAADDLAKIFDPYYTTKAEGTGLGLATTDSIVRNHGGHITVESEVGGGTCFAVFLPAGSLDAAASTEPGGQENGPKGTVLLMDDDGGVRYMVGGMLRYLGYRVETAADGREAIKRYTEARQAGRPYSAVILDVTVPAGMGGAQTLQKLREIDPEVVAIVSSGYANDPVLAQYETYGFKGMVVKPYRVEELEQVLDTVLQNG
jgi:PAS domain S-box-containing protein